MSDLNELLAIIFKQTIGLDRWQSTINLHNPVPKYPPYNICKGKDNTYTIEIAVAGFSADQLEVTVKDGALAVATVDVSSDEDRPAPDAVPYNYIHRGLAKRHFDISFGLDDHIECSTVSLKDGLLTIRLVRNIPEEKLPKKIPIVVS